MTEELASVMMTTMMLALLRSSALMTWQMQPPAGSLTLMGCSLTIHRRASFQHSCILADVLDGLIALKTPALGSPAGRNRGLQCTVSSFAAKALYYFGMPKTYSGMAWQSTVNTTQAGILTRCFPVSPGSRTEL